MGATSHWRWKVYDLADRLCALTGHHLCHRLWPIFDWARKGDPVGDWE